MRLEEKRKIMLKYLVDSTIQLTVMMVIVGMILGYVRSKYGQKAGRIELIVTAFGLACAIAMAVMKTATNKIDTGTWNLWIYYASAAAFILFLVFTALGKKLKKVSVVLPFIFLSVIIVAQMLYSLPDFFVYPHTIMLTEDSLISTVFLTKMSGVIVGLIVTFVAGWASNAVVKASNNGVALLFLSLVLLVTTFKQITASFSTLLTRRIIPSNHTIFQLVKFSSNNSNLFIYLTLGLVLIMAVLLLIRSLNVNEPYSNPAQHRKIIFKWRMARRWSWTQIITVVITVLLMTVVYNIANQEVELSPIEETVIDSDNMYITFEQVSDGHLHRFGYTTENGVQIRVIVIQKPNSSQYGIGLDACDICGETGYYEKSGQVVCNLCDVVMNINTIGFKGGCNPIVIDYSIENGQIIIPLAGLEEYEDEFK